MTSTTTQDDARAGRPASFRPTVASDRNLFLLYAALIWLGIGMGFGPEIVRHVTEHAPPYPLIVHLHAAAFIAWPALLTVQILLIRAGRPAIHRRLGLAGVALAATMLVLGPVTALTVQASQFGAPGSDPPFLAVQLIDMLGFAGLAGAAFLTRADAPAHKRLMLLATLYISDAGFARWLGDGVHAWLGDGYWSFFASSYLGNDLLIVGLGLYDLVTRRRFHPAYVIAVAWIAANQLVAAWLYLAPGWKLVAQRLLGH